jgi:hypothetical protein
MVLQPGMRPLPRQHWPSLATTTPRARFNLEFRYHPRRGKRGGLPPKQGYAGRGVGMRRRRRTRTRERHRGRPEHPELRCGVGAGAHLLHRPAEISSCTCPGRARQSCWRRTRLSRRVLALELLSLRGRARVLASAAACSRSSRPAFETTDPRAPMLALQSCYEMSIMARLGRRRPILGRWPLTLWCVGGMV